VEAVYGNPGTETCAPLFHDCMSIGFHCRYTSWSPLTQRKCSFFIVMGGTTIAANESIVDDKTGIKTKVTEYTLTPEGFEYLLDVEILKDDCLETRTIQDKGKADFLAKYI
jgi:hypothetical protein